MTSDTPWFVRRGGGWCTSISPTGPMGWLISALYAGGVVLLAALVETQPQYWPVWGVLIAASTILYTVMVWRLSVPARPRD